MLLLAGRRVPHLRRQISATGDDTFSVAADRHAEHGRQVPVDQLIPFTVQALAALRTPQAAPSPAPPPSVPVVADALTQAIHRLIATIERLDQRFSAPAEPYPTHVHTDAQIARLEQQAAFNAANTLPPGWER